MLFLLVVLLISLNFNLSKVSKGEFSVLYHKVEDINTTQPKVKNLAHNHNEEDVDLEEDKSEKRNSKLKSYEEDLDLDLEDDFDNDMSVNFSNSRNKPGLFDDGVFSVDDMFGDLSSHGRLSTNNIFEDDDNDFELDQGFELDRYNLDDIPDEEEGELDE